jgi:hypothetical protein
MKTKNRFYILLIILVLAGVGFLYYTYQRKIKEGVDGDPTDNDASGDGGDGADGGDADGGDADGGDADGGDADGGDADGGDADGGDADGGDADGGDADGGDADGGDADGGDADGGDADGGDADGGDADVSEINKEKVKAYSGSSHAKYSGGSLADKDSTYKKVPTGEYIPMSSTNTKSVSTVLRDLEKDYDKEVPATKKEQKRQSQRINALQKRLADQERLASKASTKQKKG